MDNEEIIAALESGNKWWRKELELDYKPREAYDNIKKFMPERQIIALVGLRRTGKTTIMLKIVKDSLSSFERMNIVYFSFDEFRGVRLRTILQEYSRLLGKDLDKGRYLFLLDEIQKLEGWEDQLKALYDTYPAIKFIISGSESLFIRKKSRESLAGRMYEFQIKTLNLREYLDFRGIPHENIALARNEILRELPSFFACNGFPEIMGKDKEMAGKYIRENVIEKIIFRDIPQLVPIKEPAILEQMFRIILNDPGEMMNLDELSRDVGVSRQTVSLYLEYLERSYLVRKLYNYSRNARKTQRRMKKYYPTILSPDLVDRTGSFGKLFETFIVNETAADFFWRDAYKNEVDIVRTEPFSAMEIKSGEIRDKDLAPIKRFKRKFDPKEALVISYDTERKAEGIDILPFYKYLLSE